jgi:hypothetical protein
MLEVLDLLILLLGMLAPAVALGWVYWQTRRPAALVYLFWHLLGPSLLGLVTRGLLTSFQRSFRSDLALQELLLLSSLVAKGLGAILFIWLLVSLMPGARPETAWPWRPRPAARPATDKTGRRPDGSSFVSH